MNNGKLSQCKKVILVARNSWSLYNFRSGLMRALVEQGVAVIAAGAKGDGYEKKIQMLGAQFEHVRIDQGGTNPISDLRLLFSLYRWYKAEAPDVVHHFTIKPVIYGSIAAYLAGVPNIVNTITGLGYVYAKQGGMLRKVVDVLYRVALRCATHVFFQNEDDRRLFVSSRIVSPEKTSVVPGSGVDLERFRDEKSLIRPASANVVVLIVARLLRAKGIVEFVESAKIIHSNMQNVTFRILGAIDTNNPAAVSKEELDAWVRGGLVEWLGHADDVRPALRDADIVVLPSYYPEGTPRSLLEAAAMGKVLVTTDTVGCRNVVDHGVNGLLVPARDAHRLAEAILELSHSAELRQRMGAAGRKKMEREFDERVVIDRTLSVYGGKPAQ